MHHAIDGEPCNYAAWFPVIDHIFGTYREPAGPPEPVGVKGTTHNHGPWLSEWVSSVGRVLRIK